jgi:signal recognition particle receptor subunit beta
VRAPPVATVEAFRDDPALHDKVATEVRGRLLTVDTKDDRTLFFDVLPVSFRSGSGLRVKLKLYTVPGQVMHASTRRLVLQGADAVVFVADSQRSLTAANNEAWRSMVEDMRQNGIDPDTCPMVIQFNKRDLPDARSTEELQEIAKKGKEPIYPAVAIRGEGVVETLHGLLSLTYRHLDRQYELANKFGLAEDEFLGQLFKHLDLPGSAPAAAGTGAP